MKYHMRWKADGTPFYINDSGKEVGESEAKAGGVVESKKPAVFRESKTAAAPPPTERELEESKRLHMTRLFERMGLNAEEAAIAAKGRVDESSPLLDTLTDIVKNKGR